MDAAAQAPYRYNERDLHRAYADNCSATREFLMANYVRFGRIFGTHPNGGMSRARRALEIGCDGVISSGLEAEKLRRDLGNNFLIVSPGIRPVENRLIPDDQKRIVTVEEAFLKGADYIVVGRPIRSAPDPKAKAEEIQKTIARIFQN